MNKYVKFPLVLGAVALVSGTLLAGTYQLTKERIAQGVIDRQTNAINDMFNNIQSKKVLEVPSEFASRGVTSIVEVKSNSKIYKCYTINYKDSAEGDNITVIIALDNKAKVYGVKFVNVDTYISNYYNNEKYLASVVKNDSFDAISQATFTANDLNNALKIAKDCFSGKAMEPIEELFNGNISSKVDVDKPVGTSNKINNIQKVISNNKTYYVYDVTFNDTYGEDETNILYALNKDGSLYKIKIVKGDGFSTAFDMASDLDTISNATATYTSADIIEHYNLVSDCHENLILSEIFTQGVTSKEEVVKPTGTDSSINSIDKVVSNGTTYYVYDVTFNDTYGEDETNILYALNENGSLYKIKIVKGDAFSDGFDLASDLDTISDATATYTSGDIIDYYNIVKTCNDGLVEVQ